MKKSFYKLVLLISLAMVFVSYYETIYYAMEEDSRSPLQTEIFKIRELENQEENEKTRPLISEELLAPSITPRSINVNPAQVMVGDYTRFKDFIYGAQGGLDTAIIPSVLYDTKKSEGIINHIFEEPKANLPKTLRTTTSLNLISSSSDYTSSNNSIANGVNQRSTLLLEKPIQGSGTNKDTLTMKIIGVQQNTTLNRSITGNLTLKPNSKGTSISHIFSITNNSSTALRFVPIKQVDTMLGKNDNVPIYAKGPNQGLYIESDGYRLDYTMNVPDGPSQYAGAKYNERLRNVFGSNWQTPNNSATLREEGSTVVRNVDTGIFMTWGMKTLEPGATLQLRYDVGIKNEADLAIDKNSTNKNQPGKRYRVGDEVSYSVEVVAPKSIYTNVNLQDFLAKEEEVPKNIKIFYSNGTSEELDAQEVYDPATHSIIVKDKLISSGNKIKLTYETTLKTESFGQTLLTEATVNGQSGETHSNVSVNHELQVEKTGKLSIYYQDEEGQEIAPLKLIDDFIGELFSEQPILIDKYEHIAQEGNLSGKITEEPQVIKFIYREKANRFTVHIRQMIVDTSAEIIMPTYGYGQIISQESGTVINVSMNSSDLLALNFNEYKITSEVAEKIQEFKPTIPMYYQLVGFVVTTDRSIVHQVSQSQLTPVQIDVSKISKFWLTVYLRPLKDAPKQYSQFLQLNKFGEINRNSD